MKTLLILLVTLSGCAYDPCKTTNYSGSTPDERIKQVPRYCGNSGTNYQISTYGPYGSTSTVVNVKNLDTVGGIPDGRTAEEIHKQVYGNFVTDAHGKILNWNEVK